MKNVFNVLIIVFGLITLQGCEKIRTAPNLTKRNVKIRFENIGYQKVKDFNFNGKQIGNINSGKTTKYYSFNELVIADDLTPIVDATAKVNEFEATYYTYNETGETKTSGLYTIKLTLYMSCGISFNMEIGD